MGVVKNDSQGKAIRRTIEADLNGDGLADRIRMECRGDGPPSDETCLAEQVEMGLSDGSFISIFSTDTASYISDSDALYYSPQFFLHMATTGKRNRPDGTAMPGRSAGARFTLSSKPLSRYDLINICAVNFAKEAQQCERLYGSQDHSTTCMQSAMAMAEKCIDYAESDPSNHIFQTLHHEPKKNQMNEDMVMVLEGSDDWFFGDRSDSGERMRWLKAGHVFGGSVLAVPFHEIYAPFSVDESDPDEERLKLRANVIMDVKRGSSENIGEYLYAYALGEIKESELKEAFLRLWSAMDVSSLEMNIDRMVSGSALLERLDIDDPSDGLLSLPTEIILKREAKKAEERAESEAYPKMVSAAVKRIKGRPESLDEHPFLIEIATKLISQNAPLFEHLTRDKAGDDIFIDDFGPGREEPEEPRWSAGGRTERSGEDRIHSEIMRNPDILSAIPGLGRELAAHFKANPLVDDFPESRAALARARATIPEDGFEAEAALRFGSTLEHLKKLRSIDSIPLIEKWAESDDAFLARIMNGGHFDTESHPDMLYDPETVGLMLEQTVVSPIMTLTRNNPLNTGAPGDHVGNQWKRAEANRLRLQGIKARILARRYATISPLSFVDWAIDLQEKLNNKKSLNGRGLDAASYKAIFQRFDDLLDDPVHTAGIIAHLAGKAAAANGRTPAGMDLRFEVYIPIITRLVQKATGSSQIPDIPMLIESLERYPAAHPALLVACFKKGDRSDEAIAWVKKTLGMERSSPHFKIASAMAAVLLDDAEKMSHLKNLSNHENPDVRIAALRAMITDMQPEASGAQPEAEIEGPPDPRKGTPSHREIERPSIELIRSIVNLAGDRDLRVKYLAVHALMKWNAPDVAALLARDLERYHNTAKRVGRASNSPRGKRDMVFEPPRRNQRDWIAMMDRITQSPLESTGKPILNPLEMPDNCTDSDLLHMAMMDMPLVAGKEGSAENSPTLKLLALQAISMFRQPMSAAPMLEEMLRTEKDSTVILFTAQSLLALKPADGLNSIFDMLETEKAPQKLIIIAASAVAALKRTGLDTAPYVPRLAHYLHTNDDEVRSVVATALSITEDERILPWIIARSTDENPVVRLRMAQALPHFDCAESARRAVELTRDPDEVVRNAAVAALEKYRTDAALQVIAMRS
ncbi:MAG: HEAT repeat domain-containing protein [Proteobacteria bacterium]|nr:HEAT repeat domain-containing protein [Pseudomonadota bacterium]